MKINFEDEFDNKLLSRGYDYFLNDAVIDVFVKDNEIKAKVMGTKLYNVDIIINEDNEIEDFDCTCPYARECGECKHIAAVLYYLNNNENFKNISKEGFNKSEELKKVMNNADKNELKDYFNNLLLEDDMLFEKFRIKFSKYFSKMTKEEYKKNIEKSIRSIQNKYGYIDYEQAWEYPNVMDSYIEDAKDLVEERNYELAFDIITVILDQIPCIDIDDSDCVTGSISYNCMEIIKDIIHRCDRKLYKNTLEKIFIYVSDEIISETLSNYGIELRELLDEFIKKDIFIDKIENVLEKKINILNSNYKNFLDYDISYFTKLLINIYSKKGKDKKVEQVIKENIDNSDILNIYVDMKIKSGKYNEAIELLKRGKLTQNEKRNSDAVEKLSIRLLELYKKLNMKDEYEKELYLLFFEYDKFNFNWYKKIKNLYTEKQWRKELKNIIDRVEKENTVNIYSNIIKIYIEEKMFDKIFNLAIESDDFNIIKKYEKYLINNYEKDILNKYCNICLSMAISTSGRETYREIASNLRHILKLNGGQEKVKNIIELFRKDYSNRRAMMDEINKVK